MCEVAEKILKDIPEDFGKSWPELKKEIRDNCTKNGYGSSDNFKCLAKGYAISFTNNTNFMQGKWNGGGAGFFAHLNGVGMVRTIRLENI